MKTDPRGMGNLLLVLMVVFLGFHLLILSGTLDASIYWDSTITNADAIWISESIVIVLILVFIAGIQAKLGRFPFRRLHRHADSILWLMLLYFILNLIGAFLSGNGIRKAFALVMTIVIVYALIRLIFMPAPPRRRGPRGRRPGHRPPGRPPRPPRP